MPENRPRFLHKSREKYKGLPRWAKVIIVCLLAVIFLLVLSWFAMSYYINHHKRELLSKITAEVSEQVEGNFHIEDIEPALLQGFPNIAVRLKNVTLSDSLYYQHKKNLLQLGSVYVKLNIFSVLTKHPEILKVTIADGSIYLFHNKYNYSNTYLLQSKKKKKKNGGKSIEINRFGIENVLFTFDFFDRNKQFKIGFKEFNGSIQRLEDLWKIRADTHVHFYQMAFNLAKGGFLKDKDLDAVLHIEFNTRTKKLELPKQFIKVNGTNIKAGCVFNFGMKPIDYTIDIDAPSIGFKEGTSFLSDSIASKLDSFDFARPIAVTVLVNGSFQYPDTPLVRATWKTNDNKLSTSFGDFDEAQLSGFFYNYYLPGRGRGDDNSAVSISGFKGNFVEIPIRIDTFLLYGLINPFVKVNLQSKFPVERLNDVVGNTFDFKGGTADINIHYAGPVSNKDTFRHSVNGHVIIRDGAFTYVPRKLGMNKCNINIVFRDQDLLLSNTTLATKRSSFRVDGIARNFMNVYLKNQGDVVFNWTINSPQIDLGDFRSFLTQRGKSGRARTKNRKLGSISDNINTMFDQSDMLLNVDVKKLRYNHFEADHILAQVNMTSDKIEFRNVSLNHAGGHVAANAAVDVAGQITPFRIQTNINRVKIDKLFYAFDNFGQQTLNPGNLEGALTAKIDVNGSLNANGDLIKRSMAGKVSFVLNNGELNNFEPLLKVQKFIFKKRNLSHVTFEELRNDLDIYGGKIRINPMTITSSAAIIKMEGIYAFDRGTDISIAMPLRNPEKDKELIAKGKKPKFNKGIVLYLRAKDDEKGEVSISWDPLKKGVKDKNDDGHNPEDDVTQE